MDFIIDFILHIDKYMVDIVQQYHMWTYAILFLIIFCETGLVFTPFLPGDSLLFVAGAISALPGSPLDVHLLVLIVFVAAFLGDSCNYMIGHFFGRKLFSNPDSRIFRKSYLDKTHEFYRKYGGKTIVIARFVPIVRTFAPFVAGMGKMHYKYFITYNAVGGEGKAKKPEGRPPMTVHCGFSKSCQHINRKSSNSISSEIKSEDSL